MIQTQPALALANAYPRQPATIPTGRLNGGPYTLRFASTRDDLLAVQRLRFEVFNLELDEGLDEAYLLGRDEDEFDATCHHLIVEHRSTGRVVGTYRFMHAGLAAERGGFYSESEYDFDDLPLEIVTDGAEIGRACVAADHRNGKVVHLLWKGLARYLSYNDKRYLFGCCSVPSTDPAVGHLLADVLESRGQMHPEIKLRALPALRCDDRMSTSTELEPGVIPPLMQSYLNLGTRVCSEPALDLAFKVIDFFVVLDRQRLPAAVEKRFFQRNRWED